MTLFFHHIKASMPHATSQTRKENVSTSLAPEKIVQKKLEETGELLVTFQGINISHLGKRKIIFKMPFFGGYVSSLEGTGYI